MSCGSGMPSISAKSTYFRKGCPLATSHAMASHASYQPTMNSVMVFLDYINLKAVKAVPPASRAPHSHPPLSYVSLSLSHSKPYRSDVRSRKSYLPCHVILISSPYIFYPTLAPPIHKLHAPR